MSFRSDWWEPAKRELLGTPGDNPLVRFYPLAALLGFLALLAWALAGRR